MWNLEDAIETRFHPVASSTAFSHPDASSKVYRRGAKPGVPLSRSFYPSASLRRCANYCSNSSIQAAMPGERAIIVFTAAVLSRYLPESAYIRLLTSSRLASGFHFLPEFYLIDVPGDEPARYWFPERASEPSIGRSSLSFPVILRPTLRLRSSPAYLTTSVLPAAPCRQLLDPVSLFCPLSARSR